MAVAHQTPTSIPRFRPATVSSALLATTISILLFCLPAAAQGMQLTGTVSFRERMAVPPASILTVSLDDVSVAGSAPVIVARTQSQVSGAPPFSFTLPFTAGAIEAGHRYMIAARIVYGTTLLFTNGEGAIVDPLSDAIYPVQLMLSRGTSEFK
jgi:putative lipoprotein